MSDPSGSKFKRPMRVDASPLFERERMIRGFQDEVRARRRAREPNVDFKAYRGRERRYIVREYRRDGRFVGLPRVAPQTRNALECEGGYFGPEADAVRLIATVYRQRK